MDKTLINERILDLEVILKLIFKKAKEILIVSLVISFLFGVYKVYTKKNSTLSDVELNSLQTYKNVLKNLNEDKQTLYDYLDNSILANLNSYNVATVDINVVTNVDNSNDIGVKLVKQYILNTIDYSSIAQELNIEEQYLREIINVVDLSNNEFNICIYHNDLDAVKRISGLVSKEINNTLQGYETEVFVFEGTPYHTVLDTEKIDYLETIKKLQKDIDSVKSSVVDLESKNVFDLKYIIKIFIIPFIVIAVLIAGLYFVILNLSNKLLSKTEISTKYGINKYYIFNNKESIEEQTDIVLASNPDFTEKNSKFAIISSGNFDEIDRISDEINKISNKKIEPIKLLQNNGKGLNEIKSVNKILMIEKLGVSDINSIEQVVNYLLSDSEKDISYVVIE